VNIDFVRDRDVPTPMKPLFMKAANGLVLLEGDQPYFGEQNPDAAKHGEGCLLGDNAGKATKTDKMGRTFTGHWVVKPGREVNRTLATHFMALPYDTTIHAIAVHLHPFAESLELRDLTTDTTVFKSRVRPADGKIGIDAVESYSSAEGIPVFKDHEYELVSIYNNTSGVDQDSMAVMFLYVLDKEFQKPSA
jgi:hypothetical protein